MPFAPPPPVKIQGCGENHTDLLYRAVIGISTLRTTKKTLSVINKKLGKVLVILMEVF